MSEMYRQAELEWDVTETGDGYLTSVPFYFHGFFRVLGLNILTGNHHAPSNMKRGANMKVYMDIDKTYAFENDTITYTIDYRNYGALDAQNVVISVPLGWDFFFISATGGGTLDQGTNTVRWTLPTVPGFRTATGIGPTRGTVSFKAMIPFANAKRYELKAEISCANGSGWVSNEFPNKISSVMKRNGVDIARRALRVNKTVFRDTVNPGMNATYTINFENSAEAGWMNGGRPGVNFTYAHSGTPAEAPAHTFMIRGFNDAHEAYIDYGNYRVSYFMFDNSNTGIAPAGDWQAPADIVIPNSLTAGVRDGLRHERITPGEDEKGRWNQRLILQLANPESPTRSDTNWATMAAPTQFLLNYYGMGSDDGRGGRRIHRGVDSPLKIVWRMNAGYRGNITWGDDWSFNPRPVADIANDLMANWGHPIGPDFTRSYDPDYQGSPVTKRHRKLCEPDAAIVVDNILIEEWDGYTWRRVFGNGPLPGREVNNVVILDTVPAGVTFQRFMEPHPFGIAPVYNPATRVIRWEIPQLLVGQNGRIQYTVRADALTPPTTIFRISSSVWASADRESPLSSTAVLVVTTDSLPPPPPDPTTMYKTANKGNVAYEKGDTITYTIAYKQTHGFPVKSTASSQWTGTGTNRVNATGDLITLTGPTNMYHNLTYGTNGVLTGTARPQQYQADVYIFGRSNPANNNRVELEFKGLWDGLHVSITSNGGTRFTIPSPFSTNEDGSFDYKLIFQNDSLLIWISDTSAVIPTYVHTGIPVQAGYSGVRFTVDENQGSGWLRNWASHFDLAYNITIRDTIPWGISYIPNSATGQFNTGSRSPGPITGPISMNNNVISWPIVTGMNVPTNGLGANDSLTLTWRGVVDTARNNMIVNTAYLDIAGFPRDSMGAMVRSNYVIARPPIDTTNPPDTTTNPDGLFVRADPRGGMFIGSVTVSLYTSVPGASIWFTVDGSVPDSTALTTRRYTTGTPFEFTAPTTLRAITYARGYEPSDVITERYEPLRTVPINSAIFFDDVGNGLAQGIRLRIFGAQEPNMEIIGRHLDLIDLPGLPPLTADMLRLVNDTIIEIRFRGAGIEPPIGATITVRHPVLSGSAYTNGNGYLAAGELNIVDGVAPVVIDAIYYPILSNSNSGAGVDGDTLVVTFNKYAALPSANDGRHLIPFALTYGGTPYELQLDIAQHEGHIITFVVRGIIARTPPFPAQGDSIRIKTNGRDTVSNMFGFPQTNVNNRAVMLKVRYPDLQYVFKAGPSPSREGVRIWITVEPFLSAAFQTLDPNVRIFDRMGNIVATTGKGKNLKEEIVDGGEYLITWDGSNMNGRLVGSGTYLIHAVVRDQYGEKKTYKQKIYILRD